MKQILLLLLGLSCQSAMALEINNIDRIDNSSIEDASFSYANATYCQDGADPTPSVTTPGGVFSSTAGLSINSTTGEIDLDASTPGTYTVTYTTTAPPDSRTFDVTITAVEDATFSYASVVYCSDDTDPIPTITTPGGTFSSTAGLVINSSTGEVDLDASTANTYTITYTTSGTCPASSTFDITINSTEDASFSYTNANYCEDDTDPVPSSIATSGGTFSSTAGLVINSSTGEVDLSASTLGTYTITYTTAGICPDNSTFSLTINTRDDAGFNYVGSPYCPTDTDPVATITGDGGGTFSATTGLVIDGITGEIDLSASTPGDHTITYTTGGICFSSSTFDIAILDDRAPIAQPAANTTCDAFTATWEPIFGATSYEVDVAEDIDFTTMLPGYDATSTADTFLNVTGLTATETYYYQVRAITSCGTSLNSDTISVGVLDIPVAVTNLTASNPGCNGFRVSWDAVTYASSYLLEVSPDGFATIDVSQSIPSTSLLLNVLDKGTTYDFRVTPQNVCGSGPASAGTYQTNDVPVIPTNVASSQIVCDGAMLTWDDVIDADQYLVEVSDDAFATINSYPVSNDTLVVSGLASATTYIYRIIPENTCGTGDTTAVLTFTTDSLPSAPADTLLVVEYNQTVLAWDSIVNADTYSVEVATDLAFSSVVSMVSVDSTQAEITGLLPLTTYYIRTAASNTCGSSTFSDTLTFTTPQNPLVIDSLALVDLYNATDGANWTDNTNWLSGNIDTWQGVTVADNRVNRLELNGNQLSGSFPTSMNNLTGINYADFRNNSLVGMLGDWISNSAEASDSLRLSGNGLTATASSIVSSLGVVDISDNQLTFEDLLSVVDSLPNLIYHPQATVGATTNTFRNVEDSYILSLGIDAAVTDNQYVWYLDGVAIDTTTVGEYVMDTIKISDGGVYICEVTNVGVPDLTLVSYPMTVNVQAKPNSLTFTEVADVSFGSDPFVLNASASSGLPVLFEVVEGDSLVDIQGDMVTALGIGEVTVTATQPGDDFYEAATPITRQFTINQGSQTIAFTAISDQDITLTDSLTLAISASSGLLINFEIDGPAELDGDVLWLLDTGTVTVTASQAGNELYQPAFPVSQSFLVFSSDTVPSTTEPPVDSTINYSIAVQVTPTEIPISVSLHKASGSEFFTEEEKPMSSSSGVFSEVPGGFYSIQFNSSDQAYLPTYLGGRLTLAQASIFGLVQDTTFTVSLIAKPDTSAQAGVTVSGSLVLNSASGGRLAETSSLSGVSVYLVRTDDQTVVGYGSTNSEGDFRFPNIPAGDYFFLADYEGMDLRNNQIKVTNKSLALSVVADKFVTIVNIEENAEETPPSLVTGLGDEPAVNIAAYPNPVVDRLTVEIPNGWRDSRVTVINTAGQQVLSQVLTLQQSDLLFHLLPSGLYHVRVQNGVRSYLMKIVKK